MCYQFTKNMKYMGPKGSIKIKHNRRTKPILHHHIDGVTNMFGDNEIKTRMVVGFEADKILKTFDKPVAYSCVVDHSNTNHGKIIKDILVKYNHKTTDCAGCFIATDVSVIPKITNIDIDLSKNYVFYTDNKDLETDITCNIQNDQIEYILYNTSENFWTGMVYLSNEAIRAIKHINLVYNTDPLFLIEIINQAITTGVDFRPYKLKKKDFSYIHNNSLKLTTKAT